MNVNYNEARPYAQTQEQPTQAQIPERNALIRRTAAIADSAIFGAVAGGVVYAGLKRTLASSPIVLVVSGVVGYFVYDTVKGYLTNRVP
ncbi:hypothetical membrane protein [Candidatus Protochlamydia naegleriophila]|uniref:Hypothetical membrane protein n=1 Tax=Candidatus Protochlamydia naegleriophila TaxID=389348 RepID=A0A0U5ER93_9BACT|nr:hypothetical protein [Candidatus Protochlamydia naegleriophila]CUI16691.1 hypothetical membrane protein [Candidatus Protochlamydia naegleriophila]